MSSPYERAIPVEPRRPKKKRKWRATCYVCMEPCEIVQMNGKWLMVDRDGKWHKHDHEL